LANVLSLRLEERLAFLVGVLREVRDLREVREVRDLREGRLTLRLGPGDFFEGILYNKKK
jgi:hypothetical protein